MSALPPKADIERHHLNVCFVPEADIRQFASQQHNKRYKLT